MTNRFRAAVAVYGLLIQDGRLLLMRRAGSGYHDGELSLPAGHVEAGEDVVAALIRELYEETAVQVSRECCELSLVSHRAPESPGDDYIDLFFTVSRWAGPPVIAEPDQCTELRWVDPAALPSDVIPYVATAIQTALRGERLLVTDWPR